MDLDYRNRNTLWCSVLVETLARKGLRTAVTSPGSRNTPLTIAFARHPGVEALPVLDERSAAFFALGLAKRTRAPVALVCTSGTAGANYLPAIIEARESGTPLIVLTADRPPEMRACSSGQTIDQQKLYGSYPVFYHECAVPEADPARLRYLRQTVARAFDLALGPVPGPVHLNCPFRDPLHPEPEAGLDALAPRLGGDAFWSGVAASARGETRLGEWPLPKTGRGIIIAGPGDDGRPGYAERLGTLAGRLGWPVLGDALSPVRQHATAVPSLVCHYEAILRSRVLQESLRPEAVLVVNALPTSKALRGWLERMAGVPLLFLAASPDNRDATHGASVQASGSLESAAVLVSGFPSADPGYLQAWAAAEAAAAGSLDAAFERISHSFEAKAAWLLARHLPPATPVFVANSMPVRDLEYFWSPGSRGLEVYFNRGANGIDGTLSTALGVAHGGRPSLLLTGDLSLLHDTNGFLLRPKLRGSLTIVLVNNEGGGIFEHLAVSKFEPPFEQYFATPQQVSFSDLASAYGVSHKLVRDWTQFQAEISGLPAAGIRILELRTDRKADAALRRRIFDEALAAAERSQGPA